MDSPENDKEFAVRIHYDWYHNCRTCVSWSGNRRTMDDGVCQQEQSELYTKTTTTDGHCPKWDSYDYPTVLEVLDGKWDYLHSPNAILYRNKP